MVRSNSWLLQGSNSTDNESTLDMHKIDYGNSNVETILDFLRLTKSKIRSRIENLCVEYFYSDTTDMLVLKRAPY